jgi:6-pyruvoyltetrahydropterin/6-carboxytetrahydropterin synthase
MYYIKKRFEISAAHRLQLSYESKCTNLHGHNWIVTVECRSRELNQDGMVVDFTEVKRKVMGLFDHQILNDVVNFNPTAENLARYIVDIIPECFRCEIQESEGNSATYEIDG